MNLEANTKTLIHARAIYNVKDIAITPIGGNVRFIDLTRENLTDLDTWEIRKADSEIAITPINGTFTFTVADIATANTLRISEVLELQTAANVYVGSAYILKIDGTTITYQCSAKIDFDAFALAATKVILREDPTLLEERTKPITTGAGKMKYLIVEADAAINLSIEMLHVGNCI